MWDKLTIETLIKVVSTSESELDNIDKQVIVLSVLSGLPEATIWDMPKDKFLKLSDKYKWLSDLPKEKKISEFEAGGYTWIPETNIAKISLSQYIDLSEYLKEPVKNIPDMLATISEPVKRYPLFIKVKPKLDFNQKVEALKHAKASDAYSLSLFFCRVLIHLTNATKGSLETKIRETMRKAKESQINGDGI